MKAILPFTALALGACATVSSDKTGTPTAAIGQTALVGPYRVRPAMVVEDSRCPINALCIQAGRIVVRADVRGNGVRQSRILELRKPQSIAGGTLTLMEANPAPIAGVDMNLPNAYRFTFRFDPGQ